MEAVLLNPYQYYAETFIEKLWRQHGIRTIALHTDWRTRLIRQPRSPILDSPAVAAHYMVPRGGVQRLLPVLRDRHDVGAVLPHDEGAVVPLVELARGLALPWADQPVLSTLASKQQVKEFIAGRDPSVRLNRVTRAGSPAEVLQWAQEHAIPRFVLKPDRGSGNRGVAFFDTDTAAAGVAQYFADHPGRPLAEEYIGGTEYWVNGQTGPAGEPVVTGLGVYDRRSVNGKENVEVGSRTIGTDHPHAAALTDYARRVVTAMGLRRSPFHLEAKVDDDGPCLIEVGARLCGEKIVVVDGWAHDTDLIATAVDGYVSATGGRVTGLDWPRYDRHRVVAVNGWSERADIIARVDGAAEVEALPSFLMWIDEPAVGNRTVPTLDLLSNPWSLYLWGSDDRALDQGTADVRALMGLTGLSEVTGWAARRGVYAARLRKYWDARPRPGLVESLWRGRRAVRRAAPAG